MWKEERLYKATVFKTWVEFNFLGKLPDYVRAFYEFFSSFFAVAGQYDGHINIDWKTINYKIWIRTNEKMGNQQSSGNGKVGVKGLPAKFSDDINSKTSKTNWTAGKRQWDFFESIGQLFCLHDFDSLIKFCIPKLNDHLPTPKCKRNLWRLPYCSH